MMMMMMLCEEGEEEDKGIESGVTGMYVCMYDCSRLLTINVLG